MTTAATKMLGIIGWPVAHSRSPQIQSAAILASGLDLAYCVFPVRAADLANAVQGAAALGFVGLNVTIPHKQAVLAMCEPDLLARTVGAVNTLHFSNGRIFGTNTDVHGFTQTLAAVAGNARFAHATILGQGGAARAVLHALVGRADRIDIIARNPAPIALGGHDFSPAHWEQATFARLFPTTDLVIDATSRGLTATIETLPLHLLPDNAKAIDLVVGASTAFTLAAITRGLQAVTGDTMLVHQGARAFALWTDTVVSPDVIEKMRAALDLAR